MLYYEKLTEFIINQKMGQFNKLSLDYIFSIMGKYGYFPL